VKWLWLARGGATHFTRKLSLRRVSPGPVRRTPARRHNELLGAMAGEAGQLPQARRNRQCGLQGELGRAPAAGRSAKATARRNGSHLLSAQPASSAAAKLLKTGKEKGRAIAGKPRACQWRLGGERSGRCSLLPHLGRLATPAAPAATMKGVRSRATRDHTSRCFDSGFDFRSVHFPLRGGIFVRGGAGRWVSTG